MYQLYGNFIFRVRLDRPIITKTEANIRVNMALSIPSKYVTSPSDPRAAY